MNESPGTVRAGMTVGYPSVEAKRRKSTTEFFFAAQPNERLSLVGHLDRSQLDENNHQDIEYQCPEEKEKLTNFTNRAFPNSLRNRT